MAPLVIGVMEWMASQKSAYLDQIRHVRWHAWVTLYPKTSSWSASYRQTATEQLTCISAAATTSHTLKSEYIIIVVVAKLNSIVPGRQGSNLFQIWDSFLRAQVAVDIRATMNTWCYLIHEMWLLFNFHWYRALWHVFYHLGMSGPCFAPGRNLQHQPLL